MKLDLSSLEKAVANLEKALVRSQKEVGDEELRDAVIQRFEYTYELAWKMMKRQIELDSASPATIDTLSFRDMLREAAERGLIDDVEAWFHYRDARNRTSHTYDGASAVEVYEVSRRFLPGVKSFLKIIQKRNAPDHLDISDKEESLVLEILQKMIPESQVLAFGSRVSGNAKKSSDLDLAVISKTPISMQQMTQLKEAFSSSDLVFKVDVVDWNSLTEIFRKNILEHHVQIMP